MIDIFEFTDALVEKLQSIPTLVAELEPPTVESIIGYYDIQPSQNSVSSAIYGQRPGSVLVVYKEFALEAAEGGIVQNAHYAEIYVRASRGQSPWSLVRQLTNGVPEPGDGQRWHYCPFHPDLQRPEISSGGRETDQEAVDLWLIKLKTFEVGDP